MKFSADVFEKGRENLLLVDAADGEFTSSNCGDALLAYRHFWALKEYLSSDPEIYDDEAPQLLSVIKACISFLNARDEIAKRKFPWNEKSREQSEDDRWLLNHNRDILLNAIREMA